jgi:uncharacterized protein
MEWFSIALAVFGLFVAGVIKGASGLGYASCALPFLVATVGLRPAMALIILPAMATNVSLALNTKHLVETATRFKVLYLAILPGIAVGIHLLLLVNQAIAVKTLGVVIVSYTLFSFLKPDLSIPTDLQGFLQFPAGFLNGIMTGLTGAQVMPLFPYVMALNLDPERMVQTINLAALISSSFLAAGLLATGLMTPVLFCASVLAVVPALVGVQLGIVARRYIAVDQFKRIVLATLLLIGVSMLLR